MPRIRIAVGFALFIVFASCEIPTVDFSEYVDVNFLEDHAFDDAAWIPDQLAPYMLFEAVPASVATAVGTPFDAPSNAGSTIYRLEVLNLIPNGDFEDTVAYNVTDLPDGWTNSGAPTAQISAAMTVDDARELSFSLDNTSDECNI